MSMQYVLTLKLRIANHAFSFKLKAFQIIGIWKRNCLRGNYFRQNFKLYIGSIYVTIIVLK